MPENSYARFTHNGYEDNHAVGADTVSCYKTLLTEDETYIVAVIDAATDEVRQNAEGELMQKEIVFTCNNNFFMRLLFNICEFFHLYGYSELGELKKTETITF